MRVRDAGAEKGIRPSCGPGCASGHHDASASGPPSQREGRWEPQLELGPQEARVDSMETSTGGAGRWARGPSRGPGCPSSLVSLAVSGWCHWQSGDLGCEGRRYQYQWQTGCFLLRLGGSSTWSLQVPDATVCLWWKARRGGVMIRRRTFITVILILVRVHWQGGSPPRAAAARTGTCCVDAVVWRLTQAGTTQGEPQQNRTVDWQKSESSPSRCQPNCQ